MTDKQIIIDGVDVSGCKNFSCGKCEEENKIPRTINHFTADCRMYPNCYYKQLKAKEKECEELKKIINEAKNSNLDLKSFLVGEAVQSEYEQQLDQLKAKNIKIYKTLTEIKEIADKDFRHTAWEEYAKQLKQILQKISKCEVENEN